MAMTTWHLFPRPDTDADVDIDINTSVMPALGVGVGIGVDKPASINCRKDVPLELSR